MNCEGFQSVASDLARNEILEASEQMSALAHIAECEQCGQAWSDQRELSDRLRTMAQQVSLLQAPAHLEERLRASFRDRTSLRSSRPAPQHGRYWLSAAAAALLICFGVMIWRAHVSSLPPRPFAAQPNNGASSPSESLRTDPSSVVTVVGNQDQDKSAPPKRALASQRRAQPPRARPSHELALEKRPVGEPATSAASNSDTKEVTTDFVALGYGSTLDLQDGGQLVRVELPRSALARFGLPMNMDRAAERVKADVLVGADGLARAIRFVK